MRLITEDNLAVITIWQEARGEPFDGKVAVGEVIRNRMRMKYSSDGTVSGTVLRPMQFSGWNTWDHNRLISVRLDDAIDSMVNVCAKAWNQSATSDITKGAVHYVNLAIAKPAWADPNKQLAVIGHHTFYGK